MLTITVVLLDENIFNYIFLKANRLKGSGWHTQVHIMHVSLHVNKYIIVKPREDSNGSYESIFQSFLYFIASFEQKGIFVKIYFNRFVFMPVDMLVNEYLNSIKTSMSTWS